MKSYILIALVLVVVAILAYGAYITIPSNTASNVREMNVRNSEPIIVKDALKKWNQTQEDVKKVKKSSKPANTHPTVIRNLSAEVPADE